MKNAILGLGRSFILLMFALTLDINAASTNTSDLSYVRLPGHVPKQVELSKAVFLKTLDTNQTVPLTFVLPLRNQKELEELVQRIHDPADAKHYGRYLSSEEFIERFAPPQADYDKVIAYAQELGLAVDATHSNRTLLNVTGSVGAIEKGFKLSLYRYQMKTGRSVYAPDNNPAVPVSMLSILNGVVGLDNMAVWRTYKKQKHDEPSVLAHVDSHSYPSGPRGGFAPHDLLVAYNLTDLAANGSGQSIALFELASYQASDIIAYANHFSLPSPQLTNVLVNGGSRTGIDAEVTLDIELALALAPGSQIIVYEGPNTSRGVLNTYNRIATDNLAKQVSTSWGLAENLSTPSFLNAEYAIFLQMAAHGQTIYAAAGDSGAYDDYPNSNALIVDDPASQPYIVSVGGTTLNVDSQTCAYLTESVWNQGLGRAGGGGVSKIWPIPDWQKNIPTVYSKTHRNVPDVALNADTSTGYAIFHNNQWAVYGGTSCAAPLWAAFTARVNQELESSQQPVLGFANPILYAIGASESALTDFHDIRSGNNLYYQAKKNYDNATGWGSFNGTNLFASLLNRSHIPLPPQVVLSPQLKVSMKPVSNFKNGKRGTYEIIVRNHGQGASSGNVSVAVSLPRVFSYASHNSPGWVFNHKTLTFTRGDQLTPGASYPPITLKVHVGKRLASAVKASATVSGGGSQSDAVTCPTKIKP